MRLFQTNWQTLIRDSRALKRNGAGLGGKVKVATKYGVLLPSQYHCPAVNCNSQMETVKQRYKEITGSRPRQTASWSPDST
jgi:hypothetical protein